MKAQGIFQLSVLFALALLLGLTETNVAPAFALDATPWPTAHPLDIGTPWVIVTFTPTATPTATVAPPTSVSPRSISRSRRKAPSRATATPLPTTTPLPSVASAPIATTVIASAGRGDSPASALAPNDTWQNLDAGASVWYRIGSGGAHMDVWLDARPPSGMNMAIYAPYELNRPIGRGTPNKSDPTRLNWSGGYWRADGDWYALVTNGNSFPVQYRITSTQTGIGKKSCYSYWEYIGSNYVYWTVCE